MRSNKWFPFLLTTSIFVAFPAVSFGASYAADGFSSYSPGAGNLFGQPAGGTGFDGHWQKIEASSVVQDLDVFPDGSVGSLGSAGNAGNELKSRLR